MFMRKMKIKLASRTQGGYAVDGHSHYELHKIRKSTLSSIILPNLKSN